MKAHGVLNEEGRVLTYLYLKDISVERLMNSEAVPSEAYAENQSRETGVQRYNIGRHLSKCATQGFLTKVHKPVLGLGINPKLIYLLTEKGKRYLDDYLQNALSNSFNCSAQDTLVQNGYDLTRPLEIARGLYDLGHVSNNPKIIRYPPNTDEIDKYKIKVEQLKDKVSELEDILDFERNAFTKSIGILDKAIDTRKEPIFEGDFEIKSAVTAGNRIIRTKIENVTNARSAQKEADFHIETLIHTYGLPNEIIILAKYNKVEDSEK